MVGLRSHGFTPAEEVSITSEQRSSEGEPPEMISIEWQVGDIISNSKK
jgi:hypothetical protein